jgi:hypothetical protein
LRSVVEAATLLLRDLDLSIHDDDYIYLANPE